MFHVKHSDGRNKTRLRTLSGPGPPTAEATIKQKGLPWFACHVLGNTTESVEGNDLHRQKEKGQGRKRPCPRRRVNNAYFLNLLLTAARPKRPGPKRRSAGGRGTEE